MSALPKFSLDPVELAKLSAPERAKRYQRDRVSDPQRAELEDRVRRQTALHYREPQVDNDWHRQYEAASDEVDALRSRVQELERENARLGRSQ